uniref:Uncharacterized protein n=1 Tax=Emiliania huxleyi TaxID=2903 RepID=A0A7S3T223_EMIHU
MMQQQQMLMMQQMRGGGMQGGGMQSGGGPMQMPHRGQQMPRPAQCPGGGGGGGLTPGSSEALGRAREIQPRSTSDLARNSDSHAAAIMSQARELIDSVKRRRERESGGGDFNGVVVKVEGQPAKVSRPSEPARSGAGPADQGLAEGAAAGGGGGDVQFGGSRSREERDAQLRAAAIDVDNDAQSCSAGGAAEPHHPPPVGQVRRLPSGVSFGDDEDGLLALGQES